MLYLLFISVILLFIVMYYISNKDLLSPGVLLCMMFTICIGFAVINIDEWNIDYQVETFYIMVTGIISFLVPSLFFFVSKDNDNKKEISTKAELKPIVFDKKVIVIFTIIDAIIVVLFAREILRISELGGNTLGLMGASFYYRNYTAMNSDAETVSTFMNQCLKLSRSLGFVSIFIWIYNTQAKQKVKENLYLLPPIILGVIQSLISGGRGLLLWYVGMGFTAFYIINMKKYNWKKHLGFKYIKIGLVSLFTILTVFYFLKYWLRVGNTVDSGIDYISYYAGGAIENFNRYIQYSSNMNNQVWGQESFIGIHSTLHTFGLEPNYNEIYETNSNLEFTDLGNVFGAIRRYYNDFGIIGVIILQIISSLFYNFYYYRLKAVNINKNLWSILLYSFLAYHIYEFPIDDNFFKSFISFNMFTTIIVLYFVYFTFTKIQIKGPLKIVIKKKKI